MKILIVSLRYWPNNFRVNDIAKTLVELGHDVTVFTGYPSDDKGIVFKDYKHFKNNEQNHDGVRIVRSFEIGRRNNILFRFLNYYSFPIFCKHSLKKLDNDYDVILINQLSPIMSCIPAFKYKKLFKRPDLKVVMYGMDLWPESLTAGGIKKDSFIYNHYKRVSSKIYCQCDKILVSTKEHIDYIKSLPNCSNLDIEYLPQYSESLFEDELPVVDKGNKINLMFAGNIGKAQSVNTIIEAAEYLKDDDKYLFHILGDGSELDNIKELVKNKNLNNVILYGRKPLNEMPYFYSLADIMLVTLENKEYSNLTIPGKVQTYMAVGKPIIGSINGATYNLINESGAGVAVPAEDGKALAKVIKEFDENKIKECSIKSKGCYLNNFKKDVYFNKLRNALEKYRG